MMVSRSEYDTMDPHNWYDGFSRVATLLATLNTHLWVKKYPIKTNASFSDTSFVIFVWLITPTLSTREISNLSPPP